MNEIQFYQNVEFGAIRIMSNEQGEVMFYAKDVCDALGYKKTSNAIAQHVDEGDALKQGTPTTSGVQVMLYVNESGLYSLILSSKLERGREFIHQLLNPMFAN